MILAKVLSISLCMGVGSLAFADDPPRPTSTPPAETAAAAPATADAASTVTADKATADKAKSTDANAKTTAQGGITLDQAKTLRMAGYKKEVRKGGEVYYCRSEAQMGSFFETKMCGTADDILLSVANGKEIVKFMQRTSSAVRTN
jgi:hypothetical protein